MNRVTRVALILLVALACIGCDQATKSIASQKLPVNTPVVLVSHLVQLQYTENAGVMMGIGSQLPERVRFWLFEVFTGLALCAILAFTTFENSLRRLDIFALALVLGGGVGNLLDRLFRNGIVVDFMILTLGPWKTAIFNFADLSIVTGLFLLTLARLFGFGKPIGASGNG